MLVESDRMGLRRAAEPDMGVEGVRLGNLIDGFQMAVPLLEGEHLPGAAGTNRFDRDVGRRRRRTVVEGEPEPGRHAMLEYLQRHRTGIGLDPLGVIVMMGVRVIPMAVAMMVMVSTAAQQQHAGDIDQQPEHGDRDRLVEADRNRRDETRDRFVPDEQRDHGEHDRAGIAGEVAELAGAEGETRVVRVPAGVAIGERGEQERAGMGGHVQPVRDQRDRAEQNSADDLADHHQAAEPDHQPSPPLVLLVAFAQEGVGVAGRKCLRHAHDFHFR
jgi:hypothetical protein